METDGRSSDWYVLDDGPETGTNSGTQRGIPRVPPALWKDFRYRLFVLQNIFTSLKYHADPFLVTEHNVDHVAEAFHRVIVSEEPSA